jgi:hypothetical protein
VGGTAPMIKEVARVHSLEYSEYSIAMSLKFYSTVISTVSFEQITFINM